MPRYIDADALLKTAYDCIPVGIVGRQERLLFAEGLINNAPTVSPDEVRGAGMWRSKTMTVPGGHGQTYNRWGCSKCKARFKTRTNYCPSCGAKMEVDGDA